MAETTCEVLWRFLEYRHSMINEKKWKKWLTESCIMGPEQFWKCALNASVKFYMLHTHQSSFRNPEVQNTTPP